MILRVRETYYIDILYNLISHHSYHRFKFRDITINMSASTQYRPMKYPYTLFGKIAQFPFRYYVQHSWLFKYSIFAVGIALPIFYKIQKLSYSPENVQKWDKIHREMFEGTGHH